ncbi:hypothetical protein Bca4012_064183 [Brassica carinata]
MNIGESNFKPEISPLVSFAGDTTMSEGTIKLPVYVGSTHKIVKFTIVDKPTIYNAIFGTPWIHSMKAVPSTYHQCIEIPLPEGIHTIKGSQSTSRACFIVERRPEDQRDNQRIRQKPKSKTPKTKESFAKRAELRSPNSRRNKNRKPD